MFLVLFCFFMLTLFFFPEDLIHRMQGMLHDQAAESPKAVKRPETSPGQTETSAPAGCSVRKSHDVLIYIVLNLKTVNGYCLPNIVSSLICCIAMTYNKLQVTFIQIEIGFFFLQDCKREVLQTCKKGHREQGKVPFLNN